MKRECIRWGVKHGKCITTFGRNLSSALLFWEITVGATLVWRYSGSSKRHIWHRVE
jgi:hypothetical protein